MLAREEVKSLTVVLEAMAETLKHAAFESEDRPEVAWFQVGGVATTLKRLVIDLNESIEVDKARHPEENYGHHSSHDADLPLGGEGATG